MKSPPNSVATLDIGNLVKEVQETTTSAPSDASPQTKENTSSTPIEETAIPSTHWENFLAYIEYFKQTARPETRKRAYQIEDNILETLKGCNIQNSTITNIINAALRSFIDEHKQSLRGTLNTNSLITN